jgi:hydroxyacylglutathione hydrolase
MRYTNRMMRIKKLIAGVFQANCYLVWDDHQTAIVIDPGGDAAKILDAIAAKELAVAAIIHTHGHRDHTGASRALQRKLKVPIHRVIEPRGIVFGPNGKTDNTTIFDLHDNQQLSFGDLQLRVIATPGHSPGSVCLFADGDRYRSADAPVLFTGDLLFQDGVGRVDLKGGSFREMVHSLNVRLAELPDHADVLPGHGPATTLGKERRSNPLFKTARDIKRGRTGAHE